MTSIILASNSPRRKELLALTGVPFVVMPVDVDETPLPGEKPQDCVIRLAELKARTAYKLHLTPNAADDQLILASDTIVVFAGQILGKPKDTADADWMLTTLRGKSHQVLTAISLISALSGKCITDLCTTDVPMRDYTNEQIKTYIASGDPMDKAGAYAIQHSGFHPVDGLAGCYASVMGLPLCHLSRSLSKFGQTANQAIASDCQQTLNYTCPVFASILNDNGHNRSIL